ncbi:MAG: hypothetical protein WCH39_29080 [Schlesneria sp.]
MLSQRFGLSAKSLAELALVVSHAAPGILEETKAPSAESICGFWRSNRLLQKRWMNELDAGTNASSYDMELFETLTPRLFTSEILIRTFSTLLAALDRRLGTDDLTRVARNVVSGLLEIRMIVLSRLLTVVEDDHDRVQKIDRLRRRCDRWNDLLVGTIGIKDECFEFAIDPDRARDFGEESMFAETEFGVRPFEQLVSAGLRGTFLQHLSNQNFEEPEFLILTKSILSCIPRQALHRDGSFRTSLERRIYSSGR